MKTKERKKVKALSTSLHRCIFLQIEIPAPSYLFHFSCSSIFIFLLPYPLSFSYVENYDDYFVSLLFKNWRVCALSKSLFMTFFFFFCQVTCLSDSEFTRIILMSQYMENVSLVTYVLEMKTSTKEVCIVAK